MFVATVKAEHGDKTYQIRKVEGQLVCSCSDHVFQSNDAPYVCKHIAVIAAEIVKFATVAKKSKKAQEILSVKL